MRKLIGLPFIMIILLFGCSGMKSIEDAFHKEMKANDELDEYTLLHQNQKDTNGIILYTATIEGAASYENEAIHIGYFEKKGGKWEWLDSTNCDGKWKGIIGEEPSIYCGTLTEPGYSDVYVDGTRAEIIEVEGEKRVWVYIGSELNPTIKAELEDGSEEWFKKM